VSAAIAALSKGRKGNPVNGSCAGAAEAIEKGSRALE
jgi:hypothetical protein